ncbi:MAG: imelysin family protein [Verrucomicrobiota bacterium]
MNRREFLTLGTLSVALGGYAMLRHGSAAAAPPANFTRATMLEEMARHCIAAPLQELAARARALAVAANELRKSPGAELLARTQQAWVRMHLARKQIEMLFHGPIKDRTFWTAAFFKQPYPTAIENVVRSAKPIDDEFIEILGSSAKGFFALEYLLFDLPQGTTGKVGGPPAAPRLSAKLLLDGPSAERRRVYVCALARDLERRMNEAASDAQAADFPSRFAAGGQDSINLVVNQITEGIEAALVMQLRVYLDQFSAKTLTFGQIEGAASGTSLSGMVSMVKGLQRFYRGAEGVGIDDYVRHVNPELAKSLDEQFEMTVKALVAIGQPFEQALSVNSAAIKAAFEECKTLELLCKVDVVSALGVTIMFSANDGD